MGCELNCVMKIEIGYIIKFIGLYFSSADDALRASIIALVYLMMQLHVSIFFSTSDDALCMPV